MYGTFYLSKLPADLSKLERLCFFIAIDFLLTLRKTFVHRHKLSWSHYTTFRNKLERFFTSYFLD